MQLGIGGIGDVLLLCGSIDAYVRILPILAMPVYRMFEYLFHALFPYALPEMHQALAAQGGPHCWTDMPPKYWK